MTLKTTIKPTLIIFGLLFVAVGNLWYTETRIKAETNKQAEFTKELSKEVQATKYNPSSLNECYNNAAAEYTTYIKENGKAFLDHVGETSYSLTDDQWGKADSQYDLARKNCEEMFGKSE